MVNNWFNKPKAIVFTLLILTLLLAVACGSAAAPETESATSAPPVAAPTTAAAVPATAPAGPTTAVAQPTAVPEPTAMPEATVNPGKLTVMVGALASERFDIAFVGGFGGAANYGRIIHGFLMSENDNKDVVPGIASQWGLSPDGLTWSFTIRDGVKFHDGTDLTTEDVLWTLQHMIGPQAHEHVTDTTSVKLSKAMDRIELSGPDQVSVTTQFPVTELAVLFSEAGDRWYHILPKRAQLNDTEAELAYDQNPIGAGVMKLDKHVNGYVMEFERFDDYYYQPANGFPEDKRVNFESLDLFLVPEEATRVAAVRAGEADIVPVSLQSKQQVEAGGGHLLFGQEGSAVEVKLHGCYEAQYPCYDKRVRQALHYAIDKELIRDQLYGGPEVFQTKGFGAVTPSTIGYTPELDPWPFDPDKARQLLAEAGYPGGEGFGKLIINPAPSAVMPFIVESAQLAAEFWKRELGLEVEVRVGDRSALKARQRAGELNGQIEWRDDDTRRDATGKFTSTYGTPEALNRAHEDPELFSLVQEALRTLDPDQRAEASKEMFLRLREESYELGIGYANIPWALGPRVLTWRPYSLSLHPSALHTITLK